MFESILNEEQQNFIRSSYCSGNNYNTIRQQIKDLYGLDVGWDLVRYHAVKKYRQRERRCVTNNYTALILSDLHIPHQLDCLLEILEQHKDVDAVVLNGDIIDCDEISTYDSAESKPLISEMADVHRILLLIEKKIPGVPKYLIRGNHEERWARYLARTGTALNALHSLNILEEIVSGFTAYDHPNNTAFYCEPLTNYTVIDNWWIQMQDIIICHPTSFSKIECRTAANACDYFFNQGLDFSAVIVGHTHRQGMIVHNGYLGVEQGCLCEQMKYSKKGDLSYTPWDNGYYLACFNNGKLDVNKSRLYMI